MTADRIDAALGEIISTQKPVAAAPDPALLYQLREACAVFDMSGADAIMERLEAVRDENGRELVTWLRDKINNIAYEEIASMDIPSYPEESHGN